VNTYFRTGIVEKPPPCRNLKAPRELNTGRVTEKVTDPYKYLLWEYCFSGAVEPSFFCASPQLLMVSVT
jgi:hypothetical protein